MATKTYYGEILTEHNVHPLHKHRMEDASYSLEGVNPSCGDELVLYLKLDEKGFISDASFDGDGCAISQASADIMCDLIIGKEKTEALRLSEIFLRMITGKITEEEKEELEEVLSRPPSESGVKAAFWDVPALRDVVQTGFGVEYRSDSS